MVVAKESLMTRIAKLNRLLLDRNLKALSFSDFVHLLQAYGFRHARTEGSHRIFVHPAVQRPFSIQPEGKRAKAYQLRQFIAMLEQYDLGITE